MRTSDPAYNPAMAYRYHILATALLLGSCGSGPQRPDTTVEDPDPRRGPPITATTPPTEHAEIQMHCSSVDPRQHPEYDLHLVADHLDGCAVHGSGELTLILESSASPSSQLVITIPGYHGDGTYTPTSVSVSVSDPGETHTGQSPLGGCGGCTVTMSDLNPAAPYPKTLQFSVSCPNLCNADTHTCTPTLSSVFRVACDGPNP